jgi:hypothetical protein
VVEGGGLLNSRSITHATDSDTNVERDYIIAELTKKHVIGDVISYPAITSPENASTATSRMVRSGWQT